MSWSMECTHTHTHTHIYTRTHTHVHTLGRIMYMHAHIQRRIHTQTHSVAHPHALTRTHTDRLTDRLLMDYWWVTDGVTIGLLINHWLITFGLLMGFWWVTNGLLLDYWWVIYGLLMRLLMDLVTVDWELCTYIKLLTDSKTGKWSLTLHPPHRPRHLISMLVSCKINLLSQDIVPLIIPKCKLWAICSFPLLLS